MINRRQLVKRTLAVAASTLGGVGFGATALAELAPRHLLVTSQVRDLLQEESRAGFDSVMRAGSVVTDLVPQENCHGKVIVLPSVQDFSHEHIGRLQNSMEHGAWIILERAAGFSPETASDTNELLGAALGIRIRRYIGAGFKMYVNYRWPTVAMVRVFHQVALLNCPASDVIAEYDGAPVAMKRAYGNGGFVFLGSMLGPGIRAGEPQARQTAQALLDLAD